MIQTISGRVTERNSATFNAKVIYFLYLKLLFYFIKNIA